MEPLVYADREIALDKEGYLVRLEDWSPAVAALLAARKGLVLTEQHWEIIHFLRAYYLEFGNSPNVRSLIKIIAKKLGVEKGTRKYLYDLFPLGPSRQGCRIAGLPRPNDCIDLS